MAWPAIGLFCVTLVIVIDGPRKAYAFASASDAHAAANALNVPPATAVITTPVAKLLPPVVQPLMQIFWPTAIVGAETPRYPTKVVYVYVFVPAAVTTLVMVIVAMGQAIWLFYEGPNASTRARKTAHDRLFALIESRKSHGITIDSETRQGIVWDEILGAARHVGADLIVIGTHKRSSLSRGLLGSVAENVVRSSTIPVMTIRASAS